MPDEGEAALVSRAARGDRAAFSALVAAHEARVRQFVSRVVGPGDADDVAQDALVRAWLGLARFRGEAPFGAWLAGIAWRAALDHRRTAQRAASRDMAWSAERETAACGPGAAPVELERAFATLSDHERAALVLTHGHGWSHAEAARILGLPLGTVKSLALRARAKARAAIEGAETPELENAA